jgi:hypothetical protein
MDETKAFVVENAPAPWGDYGSILVSGMCHRDRYGQLVIERTAPFVPPITGSGISILVVTDAFRHDLEGSGLRGFAFEPVVKKRIVRLDWRAWDLDADEPKRYPAGDEPEDYVLGRQHDQALAEEIGDLWGIVVRSSAVSGREEGIAHREDGPWLFEDSIPKDDLYMAEGVGWIFASPAAKTWLEDRASQWLTFEGVGIKRR